MPIERRRHDRDSALRRDGFGKRVVDGNAGERWPHLGENGRALRAVPSRRDAPHALFDSRLEHGELTKKDPAQDGFYRKVHKVELTAGKKYTINLSSHKDKFFDTYLILQDAKGKELAKNDDTGDGQAARLVYTPKQTATFQIVVTSFTEGETGKYTLTVAE